jgi:N-acyl-D-aspartate/D-glutamate deacylase
MWTSRRKRSSTPKAWWSPPASWTFTHYDAQIFWDPQLSPSSNHGVTTVIGGNCGFSIAPLNGRREDTDYLVRMLARVEGMPLDSLRASVPMDWQSFGDFLDRLEGTPAINIGFMVGHSALRRAVMGARAVGHAATAEEIAAMQDLLRASLRAGGLGFSSTVSQTHTDADSNPVPSRYASDEELLALAQVVAEFPGTTLEFLPGPGIFSEETKERMTRLSLAAARPLNWNLLSPNAQNPEIYRSQLSASDYAAQRGAKVVALVVAEAPQLRLNLLSAFLLDSIAGWADTMQLPPAERMKALADQQVRHRLEQSALGDTSHSRSYAQWHRYIIEQVFSDANKAFEGKSVADVARITGKSPYEVFLDVALADDLKTSFLLPSSSDDEASWRLRGEAWADDRTVIGASDAGAHLDMIDSFAYSTVVLSKGVRERQLMSLEEAVHRLTDVPARLIGITKRGLIREGYYADIVIFDPATIDRGPIHMKFDMPAGGGRLFADALGIAHVMVNGKVIVEGQEFTKERPGTILRAGRDTYTVAIPAAAAAHGQAHA